MKKIALFIVAVIVVSMIVKVCAQQNFKSITPPANTEASPVTYNLTLTYSSEKGETVGNSLFGANTGFTFKAPVDKSPDFLSIAKGLSPAILRFPGGTIANFYHPNAPGYGFKYSEIYGVKALYPLYAVSQNMNENILENFIRLCKETGARATFCANLFTGTPDEALSVIRRMKEAGIDLAGVELGNEFNSAMYRNKYPNAQAYITQAKQYANAIRGEFPEIPIGVIMGDEVYLTRINSQRGNFQHDWSLSLASQNFYDAVIVHYYPKCDLCSKQKTNYLESLFQTNWNAIAPYNTKYLDTLGKYVQTFFPGKKVWVTEWCTGDFYHFNNTFLQAAFTAQFLLYSIDVEDHYNKVFDIQNFHFLGTDGLIYETKGKIPPIYSSGKYAASAPYYAFSFLKYITQQKGAIHIPDNLTPKPNSNDLILRTFHSNDSTVYVYYVNSGKDNYVINFTKAPLVYSFEKIKGSHLSSVAGKVYFDNVFPASQLTPIRYEKKTYKGTQFTADPYSVGYIEFKPW